MASPVVISEFVASNGTGLQDEDNDYSDWVELYNTTTTNVNLNGWYLTDSASKLNKWRLPSTNMPPNGFLVVFASGKDRAVPGLPLHANFSLSAGGEYLALVESNGVTIATQFAPQFPEQFPNISYGLGQDVVVTRFAATNAPGRLWIATNGSLGLTWVATNFNDSSWQAATNGVGYESYSPGFSVRNIKANIGVCDYNTAEQVLATPSLQSAVFNATPGFINYVNTGTEAHFGSGATFPGLTINVDQDNFALEATGIITIPTTGAWTFGVNSDDGFRVTIGTNVLEYPSPRGPADTLATFTLAAGDYPVRLVFYECGGGSELEFFASSGTRSAYDTTFRLVGDTANGGLAVKFLAGGGAGGTLRPLIATDVQTQMYNRASSAYLRIPFTSGDPATISTLTLRMKYNDGFVAYLNGTEVARRNSPASPQWNSVATASRSLASSSTFEDIDVTSRINLLKAGTNVLALHGMNDATNGATFLLLGELVENKVTMLTNHYFATPTPGGINNEGYTAVVDELDFSPKRGWFLHTNLSITLTSALSGVTIRYTTNGSAPTESNGSVYSGPIPVNRTTVIRAAGFRSGFLPSASEAHSYIFLDQVQQQNISSNYLGGSSGDYTLNTAVTQNPPYRDTFTNDLVTIPTLSISMAWEDLFGPNGINSNPDGTGSGWERPGSVEYMRPDGEKGFHLNCGVRLQGGYSRVAADKHGFRLLFKSVYGPSKLDYDLYPDSPVKEFDTLTLHAGFNDQWSFGGTPATMHRDQWCRDTQNATGGYGPHGTFVHLYLNGVYWGVFNIGEKGDASYGASYLGGDKDEYDALNSDELVDGTIDAWNAMFTIVNGGVGTDPAYTNLSQTLNIPNFIDYMLMNLYAANTDWPGHNWNAARRRVSGGLFHFFSWDAEWTFGLILTGNEDRTGVTDGSLGQLYTALRAHPEFRREFGDHAQKLCFNGGALTSASALARWDKRSAEIDRAIVCESARWGNGSTRDTWLAAEDTVRAWIAPRTAIFVNQLRNAGLYPLIDAPVLTPFGGVVTSGSTLTLTNPNASGAIYFTLNGADPRLWGGAVNPAAQVYSTPIIATNFGIIRARVRDGTNWSALIEAPFYIAQDLSRLAVTEIMYHPPPLGATNSDELEFLEFQNTGTNVLDLSGLLFTDGIAFSFTNGTRLNPGQFFVLVRNPAAFALRYPGVAVNGTYADKLNNGGEKLTLSYTFGSEVFSFSYDADPPWPVTPDGYGFSLVRANPAADPGIATSWRASANLLGSPGAADPAVTIPPVRINEILTHTDLPQVDSIELFNPTASPADIGGWFLTDNLSQPKQFRIPDGTVVPANGFVVFTETNFNPNPGVFPSFALSEWGESLCLFSGDSATNLTGYSDSLTFGTSANGVSFGRYTISTGEELWPAQSALTLGSTNAGPRIGPVVINEIQYHPPAGYDEFIELYNLSGGPVPLFDPAFPTNTWRLQGVDYFLPTNITLSAGSYVVIVPIDPAAFRAKYGVPAGVPVFGPYPGSLQNNGERVSLEKPGDPDTNGIPYIVVDEVRYNDKAPWPVEADGDGLSLQRTHPTDYGNEPTNWFASGVSPGGLNTFNQAPVCALLSPTNGADFPQPVNLTLQASASDADGSVLRVEFFDGLVKLGEVTNPPFNLVWSNVAAGPHTVTTRARDNRLATGTSAPATITIVPPPVGTGTGLRGDYYDNLNFTGTRVRRTDATVNFDWAGGSPDPAIGVDTYSVRWAGQVQPRFSETYTFYTVTDDGVRLWVNGQLLIDHWVGQAATEWSGLIALSAGQLYDIKLEYYEDGGNASARLLWSAPDVLKETIPTTQLYPAPLTNQPPSVALTNPAPGAVFVTSGRVDFAATASDADGTVTNVAFYSDATRLGGVASTPYAFTWTNPVAGAHLLSAVATDNEGLSRTSAPVNIGVVVGYVTNQVLVTTGGVWRYRDNGQYPGGTWTDVSFNDAGWSAGPAQLGYGDGDEQTVVSYGSDTNNRYITTYFRRSFSVTNLAMFESLRLRVLRDDGAVVYINGTEVFRENLPAGTISYSTLASTNVGGLQETNLFSTNTVAPGVLILGTNIIAAEIHQVAANNNDLSFDLGLDGQTTVSAPWITLQPASKTVGVGSNVVFNVAATGTSPLRYAWYFNGGILGGETNSTLNLPGVQGGQAGNYFVLVTNIAGSITSSVAALSVVADGDGDGMPDDWENAHGLNTGMNDAGLDPDGDGLTNLQEYFAGTDPQNAQSALRLTVTSDVSGFALQFDALSNRSYVIQSRGSLSAGLWSNLFNVLPAPTNRQPLVPISATNGIEFFRVRTPGL